MPVFDPGVPWLRGTATLTNDSTTVTTDGVITLNEILEGDRLYVKDDDTILGPFEIVGGEGAELELRESFTGSTGSYPVAIDRNPITRTGAKTLRDVARILATIEDADVEAIGEIRDEAVQAKEAAENLYGDLTAVQQAKTEAEEAAGDARDDAILTAQLVGQAAGHADDAAASAAVASDFLATAYTEYEDVATGLANTSPSEFFSVPLEREKGLHTLYRNVSGGAVEVSRTVSLEGLRSTLSAFEADAVIGLEGEPIAGTPTVGSLTRIFATPVKHKGRIVRVRAGGGHTAEPWIDIRRFIKSGDPDSFQNGDVFTQVGEDIRLDLPHQDVGYFDVDIPVEAGEYIGFYPRSNSLRYEAGGSTRGADYFTGSGNATEVTIENWGTSSANYSRSNALQIGFDLKYTVPTAERILTLEKERLAQVHHGRDAAATRPESADRVLWIGNVKPDNARERDLVLVESVPPRVIPDLQGDFEWLRLYWAGAIGSENILVDNKVDNWIDRSGYSTHASALGGTRMATYEAAADALNSRPALVFDGVNNYYSVMQGMPSLEGPRTYVAVARCTDLSQWREIFGGGNLNNTSPSLAAVYDDGSRGYYIPNNYYQVGTADNDPHIYVLALDHYDSYLEIDGVVVATGRGGVTHSDFRIGAGRQTNPFQGEIAFVGCFSGVPTETQRSQLLAWAQSHYGIGA